MFDRLHCSLMKVICAPDSFKESLSAADAAAAMARGIRQVWPDAEVDLCPIADGGEGTVAAMLAATAGKRHVSQVTGPLFEPVDAPWGMLGRRPGQPLTAVMEMAAASGLALVPPPLRNPMHTTTLGTGMLVRSALDANAQRIIMGIGGSATNDGGCGMATALGVRFLDRHGQPFEKPPPVGGRLNDIADIDVSGLDLRIGQTSLTVACDVSNPLTGANGASAIYGPQKGATPQLVEQLDQGLAHLAQVIERQLGKQIETMPGAGAAGGLGAGLVAFLGARLQPGIDLVLEAVDFASRVDGATLCLTGEGRIDGQSLSGKACLGVAQAARRTGVDTIALVGSVGPDADRTIAAGLNAYYAIGAGLPVAESMRRAADLVEAAAAKVAQEFVN